MDQVGLTLRHPEGWYATRQDESAWLVNAPPAQATGPALNGLAQVFVTVEHRTNHADAVHRLREIAAEFDVPVTYLTIGGWPAMQRRVVTPKEEPGAEGAQARQQEILRITTAIAAGDLLIRAEARMPPDIGEPTEDQVRAIEAGMVIRTAGDQADSQRTIEELRAAPRLEPFAPPPSRVKPAGPLQRQGMLETPRLLLQGALARAEEEDRPGEVEQERDADAGDAGAPGRVINGGFASEPEIGVSTDGQKIVVAQQFAFATSNDGGLSFPTTGAFPSSTGGDSSLAYGKSGNFYEGTINNSSSALNVSTDGGKTFTFRANAFTCPTTGANQCGFTTTSGTPFPDQEHIAADRFNAGGNGDQVYFAWRQGNGNIGVACSSNSGQNFGAPNFTSGDFPRITVGQDGFVYVVYVNGGNITVNKYGSCQSGLAVQTGFPVTVANGIGVTCPVAGLDRCNNGNLLSSHTVAVDDGNANHVYVAYAQSSGSGESIVLQDSPDGGKTWSSNRAATLSASSTARRFMPWVCTAGGLANVSWYDRRAATASNNDLTDYYGANACVTGSGNITAGIEFQLNAPGSADAQCLAGKTVGNAQSWPNGSRATGDSTTCSEQPELGGSCRHTPNNNTDSFQACNFSAATNTCPPTETCQTAGGRPKYGDYNGNTCAAGRLYTVWASATPPPGQPATGNVDLYFVSNVIPRLFGETVGIWRYTGQPCSGNSCPGWLALDDNPATVAIAASDTMLYQLHATGAIWRSTGGGCGSAGCGGWQQLDNNPSATAVAAGANELYQLHNDGSIWRSTGATCSGNVCGGWQEMDNNPAATAIAAGAGQLYQLHNDGSIWRSTGAPCSGGSCGGWQEMDNNSAAVAIAASGSDLYQLHNDGSIWHSTGAPCGGAGCGGWVRFDDNPAVTAIATGGGQLYQLHNDGSIWRSTGAPCSGNACGGWQQLDNNPAATAIAAGGPNLYQLHNDGSIWQSTGAACSGNSCGGWVRLDNNTKAGMIAAGGGLLYQQHSALVYQLHFDGSIWRHTGPACGGGCCTGWDELDDNPATTAVAAGDDLLLQLHNDGSIWRATGQSCSGGGCPGWQQLDDNSATTAIAAAGKEAFQLHNDGSIWRSTGQACSGGACPGWQEFDNNPAATAIAAGGNQLFQLHNDGSIWRSTGRGCSG
jgi:alpha-tubulin suppressor-like RCC1 family protein